MPPETIDSLAKLGIGGLAIGALLYVIILLIRYITKFAQKHVDAMNAVELRLRTHDTEIKRDLKEISKKIDAHVALVRRKLIKKTI